MIGHVGASLDRKYQNRSWLAQINVGFCMKFNCYRPKAAVGVIFHNNESNDMAGLKEAIQTKQWGGRTSLFKGLADSP